MKLLGAVCLLGLLGCAAAASDACAVTDESLMANQEAAKMMAAKNSEMMSWQEAKSGDASLEAIVKAYNEANGAGEPFDFMVEFKVCPDPAPS